MKDEFLFQHVSKFVKLSDFSLKLLKKCCNGDRVIDVLLHFPSSIVKRTTDIKKFNEGDKLTLVITVDDHEIPYNKNAPYKVYGHTENDDTVIIIYFNYNKHYMKNAFPYNAKILVSGNAKMMLDSIQIIHPDVISTPKMLKYYVGIEPVYPLVAKLNNKTVTYVINTLIQKMPNIIDWIPTNLIEKYKLMSFSDAITAIHRPEKIEDVIEFSLAKKRIAIDELLANQLRIKQIRRDLKSHNTQVMVNSGELVDKVELPFMLTDDQTSCLKDIYRDMCSNNPMNRLLQGDVGSGKTVVAFLSMLLAIENKFQAALLAPTEILATQHYETVKHLAKDLNINIDLMLGSNRRYRNNQIGRLKMGDTDILIGTHAIFEDNVEFKNLGIVIIDEQHRFGVQQRLALIKKCNYPNVLAMSATPIPRTLMLGCFGDMDTSIIKTKPAGRIPIKTSVVNIAKIDELVQKLICMDTQVYWVCPVIEESESLMDVHARCDSLKQFFSSEDVKVLHGKMKSKEKEVMMSDFKSGKFKILVSTTVIEVGVDVPNANVIVVEHAERFGLSQLHQLRGRVGRGNQSSYCILLYHNPVSENGRKRLHLMKETTDGFILSEEDLKLRGAGDILGTEQSGFNLLRFSDFSSNEDLLQIANQIAEQIPSNEFLYKIFNRLNDDIVA